MLSSLKGLSLGGWFLLARWPVLGTLGCIVISCGFNWVLFRNAGKAALDLSVLSATIIPILLGGPLFAYLTVKLHELEGANSRLDDAARTDSLTRCLNRGAFTALVEAWIADDAANVLHRPRALLVVDADRFKSVNDRFGHLVGDEALRLIADAIRSAMRAGDVLGRLGGEEFAVFLTGAAEAGAVAERIRQAVAATALEVDGEQCRLTVSIGGASFDAPVPFNELYRAADARLFNAKRRGRNRVALIGSLHEAPLAPELID